MVKWLLELEKVCSIKCPIFNLGSDIEINIDEILNTFEEIGSEVIKRDNIIKDLDYYVPDIYKIKNSLSLDYEKDFKISLLKTINEIKNFK